jgi:hypothetical protein
MWDFYTKALAFVRFFGWIAALFALVFIMPNSGGSFPYSPPPQGVATGCGTVISSFEGGPCILISFRGKVSDNQTYERRIGDGLLFHLAPNGAHFGWEIQVVPEQREDTKQPEYVWVVTPPYHFWNPRYLDVSYGMSASEAVRSSPRNFNFVLDEEQYKKAAHLVELAVSSHSLSDKRSTEELEEESRDAGKALFKFPVAKGRLLILNSRIGTSGENGKQGFIEWLEFRVDLRVPCDFSATATDAAAEISVDHSKCSAEGGQKKQ